MKNFDKTGVLILMSHLVVTLAVIAGYLITLWMGKPDDVFKIAIPVIIGYWFGAMAVTQLRNTNSSDTQTVSPVTVVTPPAPPAPAPAPVVVDQTPVTPAQPVNPISPELQAALQTITQAVNQPVRY